MCYLVRLEYSTVPQTEAKPQEKMKAKEAESKLSTTTSWKEKLSQDLNNISGKRRKVNPFIPVATKKNLTFWEIFCIKAYSGKYSKKKCLSVLNSKAFKHFVNYCFIPKFLSKV